jgi:hypothetical protein
VVFKSEKFLVFSDGEEDEDDEGISERSLGRTPSDDGKDKYFLEKRTTKRIFLFYFLK